MYKVLFYFSIASLLLMVNKYRKIVEKRWCCFLHHTIKQAIFATDFRERDGKQQYTKEKHTQPPAVGTGVERVRTRAATGP